MKQHTILNRIIELMSLFSEQVRMANSAGLFDINHISENVLVPVFRIVFSLPDLKNLNLLKMNFPAVDLGDKTAKVSIQVTSDGELSKVKETLTKFVTHGLESDFDRVIVFVLTGRKGTYSVGAIQSATGGKIRFDPDNDILDFRGIASLLQALSQADSAALLRILEDIFGTINEDSIDFIRDAIEKETGRVLKRVSTVITATRTTLVRPEVAQISAQIKPGHVILLSGDAGTGKSAIASMLAQLHLGSPTLVVLFLDARRIAKCRNIVDLGHYLGLNGSLADALIRLEKWHRVLIVIDQFDSAVGLDVAQVLVDIVNDCANRSNATVVAISRKVIKYENVLVDNLPSGYTTVECNPISQTESTAILGQMGFDAPDPRLVQLGRNLLNLQLIGAIAKRLIAEGRPNVLDELDLWEKLFESLVEREGRLDEPDRGERLISEAIELARAGLKSDDGTFAIVFPPTPTQSRLMSERWIVSETKMIGRFAHEKMQDYVYAWSAAERKMMPSDIVHDISAFRARTIFEFVLEIYKRRDAQLYQLFTTETLE